MLIKNLDVDMEERVMAQLRTLPYSMDVDDEGHIIMTPLQPPGLTWDQLVCTHPILPNDLHWKVEVNAENQLIMSPPPSTPHQRNGTRIAVLLSHLLSEGAAFTESGVTVRDGTRVPDVGWISNERLRRQTSRSAYSPAPEICIEVISPSNSRREIQEKTRRYLEAGALEVWICAQTGNISFFTADGQIEHSVLCPAFPNHIDSAVP